MIPWLCIFSKSCSFSFNQKHLENVQKNCAIFLMAVRHSIRIEKNFINLCLHETDFGVQAEWHFFATSHGKVGVGGTVKRLAAKASLQRPYHDQITTPHQLFQFVDSKIENVNSVFVTRKDYEQEAEQLKERFCKTRTIPGTQKLHSFVPLSHQLVSVRTFSSASLDRHEFVTIDASTTLAISALSGYVTVTYDSSGGLHALRTVPLKSMKLPSLFFIHMDHLHLTLSQIQCIYSQ